MEKLKTTTSVRNLWPLELDIFGPIDLHQKMWENQNNTLLYHQGQIVDLNKV